MYTETTYTPHQITGTYTTHTLTLKHCSDRRAPLIHVAFTEVPLIHTEATVSFQKRYNHYFGKQTIFSFPSVVNRVLSQSNTIQYPSVSEGHFSIKHKLTLDRSFRMKHIDT